MLCLPVLRIKCLQVFANLGFCSDLQHSDGYRLGRQAEGFRPCHTLHSAYLQWDVPKPLQCIKTACDALSCISQQVGNMCSDFGIFQPFNSLFDFQFYVWFLYLISNWLQLDGSVPLPGHRYPDPEQLL